MAINSKDKNYLIRQLVPKSYSFDGYNEINCPNSRDAPFFSEGTVTMNDYHLTKTFINPTSLELEFSSVCKDYGFIHFKRYRLTLEEYIEKIHTAVKEDRDFITLDIEVEYRFSSDICDNYCVRRNEQCTNFRIASVSRNAPRICMAAVSFNLSDMKEALSSYHEITKNTNIKKGVIDMNKKNNFMGVNFELGMNKDPNIASTMLGIAVKNPKNGNWYTFDQTSQTIKNLANMKIGNLPIFLLPARELEVGGLYKKSDGNYEFVQAINPTTKEITWIRPNDSYIRKSLPEEGLIPGFNFYTKVVAMDPKSLMDPKSNTNMGSNVLAAMCMMQWSSDNEAEFSLDNISDDSFNGLGSLMPILLATQGSNLGGVFGGNMDITTLMLLGCNSGNNNQMIQTLILSQLFAGPNAATTSPLAGILPSVETPANAEENKVVCDKCAKTYSSDILFCPKCGSKTREVGNVCKKCGVKLTDDAMFCHKCGAKVGEDTCAKCGNVLVDGSNFCGKCGTPVNAAPPAAEEVKEAEVMEPEAKTE